MGEEPLRTTVETIIVEALRLQVGAIAITAAPDQGPVATAEVVTHQHLRIVADHPVAAADREAQAHHRVVHLQVAVHIPVATATNI